MSLRPPGPQPERSRSGRTSRRTPAAESRPDVRHRRRHGGHRHRRRDRIAAAVELITRLLDRIDNDPGGPAGPESEFTVESAEPKWWKDFERDFADYADGTRRRPN